MPLLALTTAYTGCAPKPIKDLTAEPKLLTAEQTVALVMDVFLAALATTIVVLIILASNGVPLGPMNALSTVGFWGAVAIGAFALTIVITDAIMLMVMQAKLTNYLQKVREKLVDDADAHAREHADEIEELQESNTALQARIEELEGQDTDALLAENRGLRGRVAHLDNTAQRYYEENQRLQKAQGENEAAFEGRVERMHQWHTEEIAMLRKEHAAEIARLSLAAPASSSVDLGARERELQEQHGKQIEELNKDFEARLARLNKENQEEVEELRKQASEREQGQARLFNEMKDAHSERLKEAQERAGRLEEELKQRQERLEALQLEKGGEEEAQKISEATQRELEELKRQVTEAKEELAGAQAEVREAREALKALGEQQEAKREAIGLLEQSIEEKTGALEKLEEQHKEKNALIKGLTEAIEAKTRQSEELNEQFGAVTKDIAAKREEAEQLVRKLENLTKESEDKAGQSQKLSESHRELTEKLEGLEKDIKAKTRQSGELAVSHGKMQEELKELKAQKEKIEAACEEAALQLEQKQGELANALFEAIGQQKQVVSFVEGKIAQLKAAISSGESEESEGVEANQEELSELQFNLQSYSSLIENNTAKLKELGYEVKDEEAVEELEGSDWFEVETSDLTAEKKEKEAEADNSKRSELLGSDGEEKVFGDGDEAGGSDAKDAAGSKPHPLHEQLVEQAKRAATEFNFDSLDSKLSAVREKQQGAVPTPLQVGGAGGSELPPLHEGEDEGDWNANWGLSGDTPLRDMGEVGKPTGNPIRLDLGGDTSTPSQKPMDKNAADTWLGNLEKLEATLKAEVHEDEEGSDGTKTPPPQSPTKTESKYPPTPLPPEKAALPSATENRLSEADKRLSKSDFSGDLFDDPKSQVEKAEPTKQDAAPTTALPSTTDNRLSKSDFSGDLFGDLSSEGEKSEPSAKQDAPPTAARSLRQSTASAKSVQEEGSTEAKDPLASEEEEKVEAPSTPTKPPVAETKEGPSPSPAGKPAPTKAGSPPPVPTRPAKVETPPPPSSAPPKEGSGGFLKTLASPGTWIEAVTAKAKPAPTPNITTTTPTATTQTPKTPKGGGKGEKADATHGDGKSTRTRNRGQGQKGQPQGQKGQKKND